MGHDGAVVGVPCHRNGFHGFRERADLVHLDQDRVGEATLDAVGEALGIGHEQVVAHQLDLLAEAVGDRLPTRHVVFGHAVLDRHDRIPAHQVGIIIDHAADIERLALALQLVLALLEELGRGRIQGQHDVLARLVAGLFYRLHDEGKGFVGGGEVRREAAFVTDVGVVARVLQLAAQGMEHLGTHAQGLGEARCLHRHDHEFLDVDRIVGVGAPVDDVHHRHRQHRRLAPADVAVERQAAFHRRGLGNRQRHAQDRVRPEPALVGRAVEFDHRPIDLDLLDRVEAGQQVHDVGVHRGNGLQDALAAVALLVAVPQLHRLVGTGRCAGGDAGATHRTAFEFDLDFHRGIAPAVEDFTGADIGNGAHRAGLLVRRASLAAPPARSK